MIAVNQTIYTKDFFTTKAEIDENDMLISLFLRVLMRLGQVNMSHHRLIIQIRMLTLHPPIQSFKHPKHRKACRCIQKTLSDEFAFTEGHAHKKKKVKNKSFSWRLRSLRPQETQNITYTSFLFLSTADRI